MTGIALAGPSVDRPGAVVPAAPAASSIRPLTFHVRDFGGLPDTPADSGPAMRAALQAAQAAGAAAEVVLEPGTYRVQPAAPHTPCFPIRQATNLTVRGSGPGTRIVICDPAATGFAFHGSAGVVLRDLTLDYDPLPFCQGTIRAVDLAGGTFDLEIEEGYPTPDADHFLRALEPYGKWGMVFDRATRRIREGTPDHYFTPQWEHREGRTWRFRTTDPHHRHNLMHLRNGDAYVHLARGHGSAVFVQGCTGVRLEGLTIHASPGLAVGLVGNEGELLVRGLAVRFAPGTTRLLTTNADGVHAQQNRTGPVIEESYFEGMADDAVNLYAPPNVLLEIPSATTWRVSAGARILPGDRLQVLDPRTGRARGEVGVAGVQAVARDFVLTLESPFPAAQAGLDHRSADTLYNLDACGAGFVIRRNHMKGHRRYGCLLRAGNGLVEDNLFEDTTGAGVVLTNEPDWPEGPLPWGITLRRNRFLRGGTCLGYADSPAGAALVIRATRLGHGLAEPSALRGVRIEENEFLDRAGTAIYVGGARDVWLRQNQVRTGLEVRRPRPGPVVLVEHSLGVTVECLSLQDPRPETTAGLEIGAHTSPGEAGLHLDSLEAHLAASAVRLLDHRPAAHP